jgi:caffeoyl-CoA O-methyltransferase
MIAMKTMILKKFLVCLILLTTVVRVQTFSQGLTENPALDEKVRKFLDAHRGQWHDLNVPESDGKLLYDLVLKGKYRNALEIGTSTGYSGIYIAWALSKTGGKLLTIEINEQRHNIALENFREAGLSEYIDARLADAHTLVKELRGPFDFVFSDADKDWYINYFTDVDPKLLVGACYATHNIRYTGTGYSGGYQKNYYEFVKGLKNYETSLDLSGAGMLISYKRAEK